LPSPDSPNRYVTPGGDLYVELPGGAIWRLFNASLHPIRPDLDQATYCASCGGEEARGYRCWPWGAGEWCCRACNLMLDRQRSVLGINRPPWEVIAEGYGAKMPKAARFHQLARLLVRGMDDAAAQEMPAAANAYLDEVRRACRKHAYERPGDLNDPRYQESWRHAAALLRWITLLRRNDCGAAGPSPAGYLPVEEVRRLESLPEVKVERATLTLHPAPLDSATLAALARAAHVVISGPMQRLRPTPRPATPRFQHLFLMGGPDGAV